MFKLSMECALLFCVGYALMHHRAGRGEEEQHTLGTLFHHSKPRELLFSLIWVHFKFQFSNVLC